MNALEKHRQGLQRRMMGSAALFVVFMVVGGIAGARGTTFRDDTLLVLIVLLIASFTLLPRNAVPRNWPKAATPEQEDALEMMRENLHALQNRSTYQRFFYFAIAILLIGVLPMMGL